MSEAVTRKIRCDNLNAVRLANNNFKTKSKLLSRKCHYIREIVKEENVIVKHVANEKMTTDYLTKPLSEPMLLKHARTFINVNDR